MQRLLATWVLMAFSLPVAAQWLTLATPGIPRTPDGKPDLSAPAPRMPDGRPDLTGLWGISSISGDVIDTAKARPWVQDLMRERAASFFADNPGHHCLPRGASYRGTVDGNTRRIVQHAKVVAILLDDLTYRQVFLDGRSLEANPSPNWMGYSVGRWDGDTLVVESNGFNDKTWLAPNGLSHTEGLRVTERYRRVDFGHLQLELTFDDPEAFTAPLHAVLDFVFRADDEMLEVVCNEASEGTTHYVGAVTDAHATVIEIAPATLAKYVGTYRGYWGRNLTTVDVTLENGTLSLLRNGQTCQLLPQSETTFACSNGLGYIFTPAGDEMATEVAEVHVSGAWAFPRVP